MKGVVPAFLNFVHQCAVAMVVRIMKSLLV